MHETNRKETHRVASPGRSRRARRRTRERGRALLARRVTVFTVALVLTLALALSSGGYDIVPRGYVAILVWGLIAIGFAFDLLPRGRPPALAAIPVASFALLAGLTALSLTWTESDERTFEELARVVGYAGYVVLAYCSLNRYTWRAAAAGLMVAALIVPLFSVAARLGGFEDEAVKVFRTDRLSYPLGYWNAVSCWSAIALAIGLTWSAHARRLPERCLTLAALPAAGLAVYLSYSRAGVASVALAGIAALALSRNRFTVGMHALAVAAATAIAILVVRDETEIARATGTGGAGNVFGILVLGALACTAVALATREMNTDRLRLRPHGARVTARVAVCAAVVIGVAAAHDSISEGWDEFRNQETAVSSNDPAARLGSLGGNRYDVWTAALDAYRSDRWNGIGAGSFEFYWSREGDNPEFLRDAHSLYLEMLAELGVLGLALIVLIFGASAALALQARRHLRRTMDLGASGALIAGFVVFAAYAAVDWVWEIPALVVLGLGSVAVAGCAASDRWGERSLTLVARLGAIAAALVAIGVQVPPLVSTQRVDASADALAAGDVGQAARLADQSVDAEPFAASPYTQRALVEEATGDLAGARASLGDAIEREPTNWRPHVLLARVAARQGDKRTVAGEVAEIERLAPHSPLLPAVSPFRVELKNLLAAAAAGRKR